MVNLEHHCQGDALGLTLFCDKSNDQRLVTCDLSMNTKDLFVHWHNYATHSALVVRELGLCWIGGLCNTPKCKSLYQVWICCLGVKLVVSYLTTAKLSLLLLSFPVALAPCGLRGCKNWPAPFLGQMSYKASKPGLALSVMYLSMFCCIVVY